PYATVSRTTCTRRPSGVIPLFPPARIDMAVSKCIHDGRTEITNDESPRSPDKKRDQERSEPKRDATPYTWHRPEAAKRQDRKEQDSASCPADNFRGDDDR